MRGCCVETIERIHDIIKLGTAISVVTAISPLVLLVVNRPDDALAGLLIEEAIDRLTGSRTPEFQDTIANVQQITRRRVQDEAEQHALDHNNQPEYRFWTSLSRMYR